MNVLVADAHPLVLDELVRTVRSLGPDVQVFGAADVSTLRAHAAAHALDFALIGLDMLDLGISGLRALRREFPTLALVVLSTVDDATTIRGVLALGTVGFIPKTETRDVILQALRLVQAGGIYVPTQALGDDRSRSFAERHGTTRSGRDGGEGPGDSGRVAGPSVDADLLTPRQSDVMDCLLRGRSNKVIARDLGLTEGTVKCHVAAILRKTGASNRTEVVVRARRQRAVAE